MKSITAFVTIAAAPLSLAVILGMVALPGDAFACTGGIPKAPACNTTRCTADGWVFWPVAAGTACSGGGLCDGGIIVPGVIEPDAIGTCVSPALFKPNFHLQSIIYMPPGVQSSVSYALGSSEGNRVAVQTATSSGVNVQATIAGFGASATYSASIINGKAFSMTKTNTATRGEYVGSGVDHAVRGTDMFDIAFNVQITNFYSLSNGWERNVWGTVNGAAPIVYFYTADELAGNHQVVCNPQDRCDKFNSLTPADKQAILAMNAPLQGGALDPQRYQRVLMQESPVVMSGPDYVGAPINSYTYSVAYNKSYDSINGSSVDISASALAGFDIGVVHLGSTVTWRQSFQEVRTTTSGAQQLATLTLRTNTVGCYMQVAVYIDAVFGTYLAIPTQITSCM